jgi:arginine N-succinyltransferase
MRMHRPLFRDNVLSELLPPLEPDGTSKLWEALGRKFTGLSYQEADLLSKDNKEFIHALFPDDPIHTELLPEDVQKLIGQVGPETRGVEAMLKRIGFTYAGQIDPFDGGPHFTAKTDEIAIVRDAVELAVRTVHNADGERPWAVLAVETPGTRPQFRAIAARVIPMEGQVVGITEDARQRLAVEDGQRVWLCYG